LGKGVGTALLRVALWFADNWLNLSRIEPHVYADNAAGIPLCKEFEIEDTHCRFAFRNGRYVDAYSRWRA
jgi:putative acetyltransferase